MADITTLSTEELMRLSGASAPPADISKMSTEQLMQMRAQPSKPGVAEDVAKSIPGAVPRAAAALVGLPQTLFELFSSGAKYVGDKMGLDTRFAKPTFGNVGDVVTQGYDKISETLTGSPVHRPQTGPGRIADTAAQVVVSGPGTIGQKLTMGTAAGASGEAARLVTNNPIAIGVAQLIGGGAASMPWILRSVPAENIHAAIKDITPQHLAAAQKLMDDAAAQGVKLTGAEAIAQVTGKNTLQDIQRVVESSKQGGPTIQQTMNQRPGQVRQAFETAADTITPPPVKPSATPVRFQQAGEQAITKARQAGNAAASADYATARTQSIGSSEWNTLTTNPAAQQALQAVKKDPIWGVTAEREGSIAWLDAAKRWIDDKLRTANPAEAKIWQAANTELKTAADAASPAYAQARATVAANNKNVVDPMRASPVGDIAATKGLSAESAMKAQSDVLMPSAPRALDPLTIRESVRTMNAQDPTAARDFVRQNLQAIFDESAQNLASGPNQWGGAKFASQVAGNPSQRDNLQALIESVGNRQTWNGFNRLLEVLEATGKRHAPGSQTSANLRTEGQLSAAGVGAIPAYAATPNKLMGAIGEWYDNFRFGKNTAEMAKILTDQRSVELMQKLAKEAPTSARASALVGQIIAGSNTQPSSTNR